MNDWIKIRPALLSSPKLTAAAIELTADGNKPSFHKWAFFDDEDPHPELSDSALRFVTLGVTVALWGVTREFGIKDGNDAIIPNLTVSGLDIMVGVPGIGKAIESVGWAIECDEGVRLPNFFEHNSLRPSDKPDAVRQRGYRQRQKAGCDNERDNPVTDCDKPLLEKSRVEKSKKNPPTPLRGELSWGSITDRLNGSPLKESPEFRTAWNAWVVYRKERRKPLTASTVTRQIKKLAGMGVSQAVASIERSIEQGWTGLFDETKPPTAKPPGRVQSRPGKYAGR